jgi:hypothetical protein
MDPLAKNGFKEPAGIVAIESEFSWLNTEEQYSSVSVSPHGKPGSFPTDSRLE